VRRKRERDTANKCTRKKERERERETERETELERNKIMCGSVWELSMVEVSVFTKRHEGQPKNAIGNLIPKQMPEPAENVGAENAGLGISFNRTDQNRTKWYFGNMDNQTFK